MRKDKEQATEMRRSGKSYKEIRTALRIPVSTLSDWFSEVEWSKQIKYGLTAKATALGTANLFELSKIRGVHLTRIYSEARVEARKEMDVLKYNPLFLAGMMLYWGEGDKATKCNVRLANTDPMMLRLFYTFLQQICGAPPTKIAAHVLVYPDLDELEVRKYWSENIGMPIDRFTKSTLIQGRHPTKRLGYGVCTVVISSTYLKVKILEWMSLLPPELISKEYYENIGSKAGLV